MYKLLWSMVDVMVTLLLICLMVETYLIKIKFENFPHFCGSSELNKTL